MNRLARYSTYHPKLVISLGILGTLAVSPGLLYLELRTDGHALVPPDAPEIKEDLSIREQFGLEDPIVVSIRASESSTGIFNAKTLKLVDDLTRSILELEGIDEADVVSLATETNDRVWPGTLRFRKFLEPLPQTEEEVRQVRADVLDVDLYTGTIVSKDKRSTAILVRVPRGADRLEMIRRLWGTIEKHQAPGHEIGVIGAPVAEALLGTHILEDLGVPAALLGHRTFGRERVSFPPRSFYEAKVWIARTVGLVPLAIGLMAIIFFAAFRSIAGVVLPLMEVGACLLFVFAVMGWLGIPIYLTIAVMPIILTAAGVTDEIHIFTHYTRRLRSEPHSDPVEILRKTMEELSRPVVMAAVTTAIGFLSFTLSEIAPVRAFGWMTSLGILFCMAWSLTVIPASLAVIGPERLVWRRAYGGVSEAGGGASALSGEHSLAGRGQPLLGRSLARGVLRCRAAVVLGTLALILACPSGIQRLIVQDSWIDGFAPESDFHRATTAYNEQFFGGHVLLLAVDAGHSVVRGTVRTEDMPRLEIRIPRGSLSSPQSLVGQRIHVRKLAPLSEPVTGQRAVEFASNWYSWITEVVEQKDLLVVRYQRGVSPVHFLRMRPQETAEFNITPARMMRAETLKQMAALEDFIRERTQDAVGGVLGVPDYLRTVNYMSRGRKPEERIIPESSERIEWLWGEFNRIRGEERLRQLVDADYSKGMVTILLKNANFVDTARLMSAIREYEQKHLATQGMRLSLGGDVAVSQTLIQAIVGTQVVSVIGSLVGDLAVTTVLGRSLVFGLLCVLPSSLAVLVNFAVMGWVGMPLGVASSMFSAMTLGVGVDYAIHLLERMRHYRRGGMERRAALIEAMGSTGASLFGNTLAVAAGFGILVLSQVPANARLGGLLSLSLVNCFLATVIILPAFLAGRRIGGEGAAMGEERPQAAIGAADGKEPTQDC